MISPRHIWYAAPLALALACTNNVQHVFGAYLYDPEADCLESPAAVEIVEGPDPGPCEQLRCWISPGEQVYVTDAACEAPPGFDDHTADEDGDCHKALEVYEREEHGECVPSAGSSGGES